MAADRPPTSRNRRLLMLNMVGYPPLVNYRPRAGQYPRYGYQKIRVFLARRGHAMPTRLQPRDARPGALARRVGRRGAAARAPAAGRGRHRRSRAGHGALVAARISASQPVEARRDLGCGEDRWQRPSPLVFSPSESHKTRPRRMIAEPFLSAMSVDHTCGKTPLSQTQPNEDIQGTSPCQTRAALGRRDRGRGTGGAPRRTTGFGADK